VATLERVHGIIDRHEDSFLSVLSGEERGQLITLLRRLYERRS
jgi:hypothetical protein